MVGVLNMGDAFGQDVLRHENHKRMLTVAARTDMQLLHLNKEHFLSIFLPEYFDGNGVSCFIAGCTCRL
jgi:hypothetical protein